MDAAAGPFVRARHDLARGRPDRALDALSNLTGADLDDHTFWSLRAAALYDLRRWNEATEAAQEGLARAPGDYELLDVLALAQLEGGDAKRALATVESALTVYPDDATLHAHRALIVARTKPKAFRLMSYKKARAAVDQALRLDPTCEAALRVRAHIATASGDPRATEYGAEVLALDPESERAHLLAGNALAKRGELATGLRHYVEAARLDPSNPRLAWIGRRSRVLQGPLGAPLLLADRLTRGHFRFVWFVVIYASFRAHQPVLTVAVLVFWAYIWAVHFYLRFRFGKEPE
jgi:tetratricopeptide (TPR) repeat protein